MLNMVLNGGLAAVIFVSSTTYWYKMRTGVSLLTALVGLYVTGLYLYMLVTSPEVWQNGAWAAVYVRPAISMLLFTIALRTVAGAKRVCDF